MAELTFTGERVVPGQVDADLWNEHYARYLFAARFASGKRVLDLGCGAGYGSALMAETAAAVIGVDLSAEAVEYARSRYGKANLQFQASSCTATSLPDAAFDLITAFEIIEHLADWPKLLTEARRMLAPDGQFLVSTPNKSYYAESRELVGSNPYHVHEFEFAEFEAALREVFPSVSLYTQNHASATVLQPCLPSGVPELRIEEERAETATAHFYFAICALTPQMGASAFVHVPRTANVLRERELHIARLEGHRDQLEARGRELGERVLKLQGELEAANAWSQDLSRDLDSARTRIVELQQELTAQQAAAQKAVDETQARFDHDIAEANRLLDEAQRTIEERTKWALDQQAWAQSLEAKMAIIRKSIWYRLGRKFGLRLGLKPGDEAGGPPSGS